MENSFLMLFLHYDVPEYPNPRWPPDAILKISFFFTFYHGMLCKVSIQGFSSMKNPFLMCLFSIFKSQNIQIQDGRQKPFCKSTPLYRMLCLRLFMRFLVCRLKFLLYFGNFLPKDDQSQDKSFIVLKYKA